jgi:hypothetical protein
MIRGLIPDKTFSVLHRAPDRLSVRPSLLFIGYCGSLPEVKRPGREVDHFYPSSAEVKNEWKHNSTSPYMPSRNGQGQLLFHLC